MGKKSDSSDIALKVEHVSKSFRLPTEQSSGIKQAFINYMRGVRGYTEQHVLNDISFEVKKGDFFGIVGRNGSGKSTLLKIISEIYAPEKGKVTVNGSLVPFIELGVGFNPELTGRENVYLNGAMLGFSKSEIDAMYDEIVEFAELHEFMDQKLKNYSSGMQVRLAFSVAIKAQGDILVLDEVLAVGDEAFQRKCFQYFAQLKKEKRTVILVTHDMNSVARFCNKAMLINKGKISTIGNIKDVVRGYEKLNQTVVVTDQLNGDMGGSIKTNNKGSITATLNESNSRIVRVGAGEKLKFDIEIIPEISMENIFLGLVIQKSSGENVYWYTTEQDLDIISTLSLGSRKKIRVSVQNIFGNGEYSLNLNVKKNDRSIEYIVVNDAVRFEVSGWNHLHGWMYHPDMKIESVAG